MTVLGTSIQSGWIRLQFGGAVDKLTPLDEKIGVPEVRELPFPTSGLGRAVPPRCRLTDRDRVLAAIASRVISARDLRLRTSHEPRVLPLAGSNRLAST